MHMHTSCQDILAISNLLKSNVAVSNLLKSNVAVANIRDGTAAAVVLRFTWWQQQCCIAVGMVTAVSAAVPSWG